MPLELWGPLDLLVDNAAGEFRARPEHNTTLDSFSADPYAIPYRRARARTPTTRTDRVTDAETGSVEHGGVAGWGAAASLNLLGARIETASVRIRRLWPVCGDPAVAGSRVDTGTVGTGVASNSRVSRGPVGTRAQDAGCVYGLVYGGPGARPNVAGACVRCKDDRGRPGGHKCQNARTTSRCDTGSPNPERATRGIVSRCGPITKAPICGHFSCRRRDSNPRQADYDQSGFGSEWALAARMVTKMDTSAGSVSSLFLAARGARVCVGERRMTP